MPNDMNDILKAPSWQMDDAYGSIGSPRWQQSSAKIDELTEALKACAPGADILQSLGLYEEALTLISSLAAFAKCTGAKDSTDPAVGEAENRLNVQRSALEASAGPLFKAIEALPESDEAWAREPLAHWRFALAERRSSWKNRLSKSDQEWLADLENKVFFPLGSVFKRLQSRVRFPAKNSAGEEISVGAARMVTVIKGDPDRELRRSVSTGMNGFYDKNADLYAALLNELHGFRLSVFDRAGLGDPLEASLHQNRMSRQCLNAIREAIYANRARIRKAVTLRAPFFGGEKLEVFDLMAPAPGKKGTAPLIPYEEGIGIVKKALSWVNPEMAGFIDLMLSKGWVDAVLSDKKIGGAFYSRFNEFRIPRVFSSYTGSITAILQQGHELGHAFHYWQIRDLPVIETEFPMTLTETASTFNEAVIRKYLYQAAGKDEQFAMLWQEMRSAANFLLNTIVRMDFELAFLEERRRGPVSADACCRLMDAAWRDWYSDSTEGTDRYLWAYKLHYYKTDQFIYNYPYTVGYLISQALMKELSERGADFYPFYIAMLRDTGRMTVDGIIRKHFGADASDPSFWESVMKGAFESIDLFSGRAAEVLSGTRA